MDKYTLRNLNIVNFRFKLKNKGSSICCTCKKMQRGKIDKRDIKRGI